MKTETRTDRLRDKLIAEGARLIWRAQAPGGEMLAYNTPKRGVILIHDYGKDGYDLYLPWHGNGTPVDAARVALGEVSS